jgi:hypothetical protein
MAGSRPSPVRVRRRSQGGEDARNQKWENRGGILRSSIGSGVGAALFAAPGRTCLT